MRGPSPAWAALACALVLCVAHPDMLLVAPAVAVVRGGSAVRGWLFLDFHGGRGDSTGSWVLRKDVARENITTGEHGLRRGFIARDKGMDAPRDCPHTRLP